MIKLNIMKSNRINNRLLFSEYTPDLPDPNPPAQTYEQIESERITLPNGWKLTPVGKTLTLGDLPLNIALSPDEKLAAVTNNGQSDQTIQLVDIENEKVIDSTHIAKSWLGLTFFSGNGKYLYASGRNDNRIIKYPV